MTKELEYGKWYPIEEYFRNIRQMDWALVQFKETKSGFMGLPHIAELRNNKWYIECDDEELYTKYINEDCEPIAFMLWQPYNEDSSLEAIDNAKPSEAFECLENFKLDLDLTLDGSIDRRFINGKSYEEILDTIKQALLKAQEKETLFDYLIKFIKNVEVSDSGVYYVSFKNNTPYLDCIEIDKGVYSKIKEYTQK